VVRLERHRLGPRVFVLGRRAHEWHLGLVLVVTGSSIWAIGSWAGPAIVAVGAWLVVKDWRDLFASRRDHASWQLGLHRPVGGLRALRRSDSLPALAALVTLVVGLVNLLHAVAPGLSVGGYALLRTDAARSLYRFNAKFFPRWEPRYFLCEGKRGFPRAGLAALRAEGQLPKPRLRQRSG
jgi:hypothetical protein